MDMPTSQHCMNALGVFNSNPSCAAVQPHRAVGMAVYSLSCFKPSENDFSSLFLYHKEGVFHGLIPILNCYLENMEVDVDTRCTILNYLKLIKKRASGKRALKEKF